MSTLALTEPQAAPLQPLPPALDARTAATLLRMSPRSVYRAMQSGDLPVLRVGRRVVVPTAALLVMLGVSQQSAEQAINLGALFFPSGSHSGVRSA